MASPAGPVPQVAAILSWSDHWGTIGARIGIQRDQYTITPGLYCVGRPDGNSPVFVTANYKLTFDALRRELGGVDVWILVVDTRGINVWCAAGKGTFSTEEIAYQVQRAKLMDVVNHRELILPQYGAPGVSALKLKNACGFKGTFGPIRARDIKRFLESGQAADEAMRSATFKLKERAVLIPLELFLLLKPLILTLAGLMLLSGFGPDIYSLDRALHRGGTIGLVTIAGVLAGTVLVPLLLPWIPGRQFWFKGLLFGIPVGIFTILRFLPFVGWTAVTGMFLWAMSISSYLAMNFTGSTPYTSLSGVKIEMRKGLAIQLITALLGLSCWLAGPFFL
ncbi:MAG: hypothetical protein K0A99_10525 [Desulfoarculaceae bacterium]|nr:hypothetical protein [Desulfoarculaceae bacterium]